jgi:excisionase family DNA binding protein
MTFLGHSSDNEETRGTLPPFPGLRDKHPLLTTEEVVYLTNTSAPTVKRWVVDGTLRRVKLGKLKSGRVRDNRPVRFRIEDVAALTHLTTNEIHTALAIPAAQGGVK